MNIDELKYRVSWLKASIPIAQAKVSMQQKLLSEAERELLKRENISKSDRS